MPHPRLAFTLQGQTVSVPIRGELTVGRGRGNDLKLLGAGLSRRHAAIRPSGEGYALVDLGSKAGTFLDGEQLQANVEVQLPLGATFRVADLELRIEAPAEDTDSDGGVDGDADLDVDASEPAALLLETIAELHTHPDPTALLPVIADRALRIAGAERALVLVRGEAGLETLIAQDRDGPLERVEGTSQSLPRQVLSTGEAVCITQNADGDSRSQSMNDFDLQAILCVPIRRSGSVVGVLYVDSSGSDPEFSARTREFLEALAAQCGIALERARARQEEVLARQRLEDENAALKGGGEPRPLATSQVMAQVLEQLERVADAEVTLLITGETGVGKEVLARHAHGVSHRRARPFVVVDCGAIPEALLESVLFGHKKGAFTGATADKQGLVAVAAGGTLLLDEVGELPLALQPKLLRFLEERTYLPVGGEERATVDVRIVACTHRDLLAMVGQGTFREDLYFRLNSFPLTVPPLRDRPEDLVPLARLLLGRARRSTGRSTVSGFTLESLAALQAYSWPGNVRELAHRIERATLVAEPPFITVGDLDLEAAPGTAAGMPQLQAARKAATTRFEIEYVSELLRRHRGRVQPAAQEAGVSRQLLQRLMTRHGLTRQQFDG